MKEEIEARSIIALSESLPSVTQRKRKIFDSMIVEITPMTVANIHRNLLWKQRTLTGYSSCFYIHNRSLFLFEMHCIYTAVIFCHIVVVLVWTCK